MGRARINSFLWTFLIVRLGYTNVVVDEIVEVAPAEAVVGAIAILPCDLTPPLPQDKVHLVIWYKDFIDMPIYSYDARGTAPEKGTHWAAETSLGERAFFRYKDVPSKLVLQNIREADAGLYRCRVDFRQSPTRNSKVNLTIILPPQKLSVLDDRGAHIQHYILGPYPEGAGVSIACLSTGGRPLPRVTWWQENALLDDSYETLSDRRVRNVLHLERLERRHLHTVFTCQAANNQLVAPISSAVTLDLYLDPLWVRLLGVNRPMSADQPYEVACEVVGSRPAPIVTWWKGGVPLRGDVRESSAGDGNVTLSVLRLTPSLADAGQVLSCRATTPPAERALLQDSWTLNIYHVPLVYLELVGNRTGAVIREGVDLLMECRIKANPWVYRVSWRHNGQILYHNASEGTVVANQTLGLANVTRARAGIYTCVGSNQEGDGESNPVLIDVKFPPDISYDVVRVRRSPDQRSKRRRKNREAVAERTSSLDAKKETFLTDLTVDTVSKRDEIAYHTRNQTASQVWHRERRKRLTASRFGAVCARKDQSSCKPVVFDILYRDTDNVFTRHGTRMEPEALKVLRERFGVRGRRCGVFIDPELSYLAATPDGLVGDDAIIEVKCPYRAGEFDTPLEAVRNGALPYLSAAQNGSVWLKRRALYHYQIQGQLHITRRDVCHFLIYTHKWAHYEVVRRDDQFWNNKMVNKLKRFYMDCLLPEIVDPQFPAKNKTDDIREGEFIVNALRKAVLDKEAVSEEEAKRLRAEERRRVERQFENLTLIMRKKRFAPVCRPGQQRVVAVARQETARVSCEVEANPASVQFAWSLNSSSGSGSGASEGLSWSSERLRSTVAFTAADADADDRLLCWATNELGAQREPCVFTLVPAAGRPDPLANCSIANQTVDGGLVVHCEPGNDNGLAQAFVLEVYDAQDRSLERNLSSARSPQFLLEGLEDGLELELVLYAVNAKGAGRHSTLHAYTLRSAARRSVVSPVMLHVTPAVGVLIGAVATFLLALLAVLVALRLRRRRPASPATPAHAKPAGVVGDSVDSLDREPDVIPQKNDFVDTDEAEFRQSKLSFYFSPESDAKSPPHPVKLAFSEAEAPAEAQGRPSRRVTFQCQAATLPRRLGAQPPLPPPSATTTLDDSALGLGPPPRRLRPETSTAPL